MTLSAEWDDEVLQQFEVNVVEPRIHSAEAFRDFTAVRIQVLILLHEGIESGPLIRSAPPPPMLMMTAYESLKEMKELLRI